MCINLFLNYKRFFYPQKNVIHKLYPGSVIVRNTYGNSGQSCQSTKVLQINRCTNSITKLN